MIDFLLRVCLAIYDYHWDSNVKGRITKVPADYGVKCYIGGGFVAMRAVIMTVLPKPISSASIPPLHFIIAVGLFMHSCPVNSLKYKCSYFPEFSNRY